MNKAILISEFMTKNPKSVRDSDSLYEAYQTMRLYGIRHLPVLDKEDRVIGIFTHTDLNKCYPPKENEDSWFYDKDELSAMRVGQHMTKEPAMLIPEDTLREAALTMVRGKYACIPVISAQTKKLVGIVTYIDVLKKVADLV
jgi:CBS domain-containing protein